MEIFTFKTKVKCGGEFFPLCEVENMLAAFSICKDSSYKSLDTAPLSLILLIVLPRIVAKPCPLTFLKTFKKASNNASKDKVCNTFGKDLQAK